MPTPKSDASLADVEAAERVRLDYKHGLAQLQLVQVVAIETGDDHLALKMYRDFCSRANELAVFLKRPGLPPL